MSRKIKEETIQKIVSKINNDLKNFNIQKVTHLSTYRGDCSNGQYKFVLSSENYPDICSDFNIGDFLKSEKLNYNLTRHGHIHIH